MPGSPGNPISVELAAVWRARWRWLQAALREPDQQAWAWLWRIRLEILTFLMQQHGVDVPAGDESVEDHCSSSGASTWLTRVTAAEVQHEYRARHVAGPEAARHAMTPMPTSTERRTVLDRLQRISDETRRARPVYEPDDPMLCLHEDALRRLRIYNLTFREPPIPVDAQLSAEECAILERYQPQIRAMLAGADVPASAATTLSDDEIVAILTGNTSALEKKP